MKFTASTSIIAAAAAASAVTGVFSNVFVHGLESDDPIYTNMEPLLDRAGDQIGTLYYKLLALEPSLLPFFDDESEEVTAESRAKAETLTPNAIKMMMKYTGGDASWLGVGLSPNLEMTGTEAVIGILQSQNLDEYPEGSVEVYGPITGRSGSAVTDPDVSDERQDLILASSVESTRDGTILTYIEALAPSVIQESNIDAAKLSYNLDGSNDMAFAVGPEGQGFPSYHGGNRNVFSIDLSEPATPRPTELVTILDEDKDADADADDAAGEEVEETTEEEAAP